MCFTDRKSYFTIFAISGKGKILTDAIFRRSSGLTMRADERSNSNGLGSPVKIYKN